MIDISITKYGAGHEARNSWWVPHGKGAQAEKTAPKKVMTPEAIKARNLLDEKIASFESATFGSHASRVAIGRYV